MLGVLCSYLCGRVWSVLSRWLKYGACVEAKVNTKSCERNSANEVKKRDEESNGIGEKTALFLAAEFSQK
jgi:hypothetical protein